MLVSWSVGTVARTRDSAARPAGMMPKEKIQGLHMVMRIDGRNDRVIMDWLLILEVAR